MPVPAFSDLVTPSSNSNGLFSESKNERILSLLAMLASGTAPDGTALPSSGGAGAVSPLVLTAHTATETPLTLVAAASQTADLQQWNSATQTLLRVDSAGDFQLGALNAFQFLDPSGNKLLRIIGATAWSDNVNASFLQVGNSGYAMLQGPNGALLTRLMLNATAVHVTNKSYSSATPPGANLQVDGNTSIGSPSFGGGTGTMLFLGNDTTDPSTNPVGGTIVYSSAGVLKAMTPDGTVTNIAPGGDTSWTNVSVFTNSWASGAAPNVARYRLLGTLVELQGRITGGTLGQPAFTLPAGYRPTQNIIFATDSNSAYGQVTIASNGVVTPGVGATTNVSIHVGFSII